MAIEVNISAIDVKSVMYISFVQSLFTKPIVCFVFFIIVFLTVRFLKAAATNFSWSILGAMIPVLSLNEDVNSSFGKRAPDEFASVCHNTMKALSF